MENILETIIEKNRYLVNKGKVADYIPALAEANPNYIGICLMDMEGNIYKAGDYDKKFTIQSISKVISLMLAIMDNGEEKVFNKVDYEPTDEPFNSFYKLDLPHSIKPSNPMINAGAIVATSLIKGSGEEKFNRLLNLIRKITENPNITYNEEIYLSEKDTGDKNRAMAYLMKNMGIIEGNVEAILDSYFKQCAIEVDCLDIAKIGLFLANRCRVLNSETSLCDENISSIITAIMTTSGMYNFSGEYAVKVGIPSKSGVAGGILATVPKKMGIGLFCPALDQYGNSIVGYGIMKDLSKELKLSIF
ncbi:glutaminase A [Tissierella sp. MSJ-40]|uniref:Glutaminase n=1 Tax=Tissierella simiarum TaxID=2841534 RepID=A0ABS6E3A2_9FIRM|nr:glutaminase A [Tissierella simiarum]MBU5437387.1 glutaminase A [Tissierella simiarum]